MSSVFQFLLRGKTLGRALFTEEVRKHTQNLNGEVIDLGSGVNPSYLTVLPSSISHVATDKFLPKEKGLSIDLNEILPFEDSSVKTFFCFNVLYILDNPEKFLHEVNRTLVPGGVLLLSSPLIWNEIPEPHDYARYTGEGITRMLTRAGFLNVSVTRYGERFSAASNLLDPFLYFKIVRIPVHLLALLLDKIVPAKMKSQYPAPIGYFVIAKKS